MIIFYNRLFNVGLYCNLRFFGSFHSTCEKTEPQREDLVYPSNTMGQGL